MRCVWYSSGIEIHWIDALTNQSVARSFPLTAPSDYLSFLPAESHSRSAKKLRLLSSTAHPKSRQSICHNLFLGPSMQSSLWRPYRFESQYHAVPLSDPRHVLFIDQSTSRLTLGCFDEDMKISNSISFVPPIDDLPPTLYSAAKDMSQGLFVITVYNDILMLYSIPSEVFKVTQLHGKVDMSGFGTVCSLSTEERKWNHWRNWWDEPAVLTSTTEDKNNRDQPKRQTFVHGTEISRLPGVCELSIQMQPDMLIWAFTASSQCKTWRLRSQADPEACLTNHVCPNGLVHNCPRWTSLDMSW